MLLSIPEPGDFSVVSLDTQAVTLQRYPNGEVLVKDATEFALEYANGDIWQTAQAGQELRASTARHLLALVKPEGRMVTVGEMEDWEKQWEEVIHARTKQFYGNKYIDQRSFNLDYTKTEDDLAEFMRDNHEEAGKLGLGKWTPSATVIRVLVRNRTRHVSLVDCMRKDPAIRARGIWPQWTYTLAHEAIDRVFRRELPSCAEAYKWFFGQFYLERDDGVGIEGKRPDPPTERVFRNWFSEASKKANLVRLHGARKVNKSLKGVIKPQDAVRPLQIVIIDQTLGNIWSAVKSRSESLVNRALPRNPVDQNASSREEEPKLLTTKRPEIVYAVDVFSRKTLAFILTFEPPSIATFMACLRMVMTPKIDWMRRYPDLPDATAGHGSPETVVLDNLRVHVTDSVQLGLLAMNIAIEYAALASPEWKAIVERAIGTVKGVMAVLPGGFPINQKDINSSDYRKYARLDLDEIDELVTHRLVTEHHTRPHAGTNEPPGSRFVSGLERHGRGVLNDLRQLDLMLRRRKPGATLTRNGVEFKGHRYHDEGLVSRLLEEFSAKTKGKLGHPVSVEITILWKLRDCSSIGVIGPGGKEPVELRNVDPLFANTPVSFDFAAAAKKANAKIFELKYPPEKRAKYLREYFERLEQLLPKQTHKAGKTTARLLEGGRPIVIPPDVRRFDITIPVTNLGVSNVDIPFAYAADEGREPPTTPKRSAPKAKSKPPEPKSPDPQWQPPPSQPSYVFSSAAESEAFLDQLEAEMAATRH
ncbi:MULTISPECIES: DDE-type integrase/transposase/recombinase [unclassified Rhizobium]|uniref:DDE-type integrase/transposase/recombinase n=1 Tax=unclassified Rhizobium TaxID=2613769 RepID=UPI00144607AB|nr:MULTISPECIES: DDE-type integrase/transposase/recombinase [unclassified Rhizobium]NKJ07963.1 putative transposase [Rhizobium sp. SG741]NKJ36793.1 putative transposase [Rhizobium sp. SG570]